MIEFLTDDLFWFVLVIIFGLFWLIVWAVVVAWKEFKRLDAQEKMAIRKKNIVQETLQRWNSTIKIKEEEYEKRY